MQKNYNILENYCWKSEKRCTNGLNICGKSQWKAQLLPETTPAILFIWPIRELMQWNARKLFSFFHEKRNFFNKLNDPSLPLNWESMEFVGYAARKLMKNV